MCKRVDILIVQLDKHLREGNKERISKTCSSLNSHSLSGRDIVRLINLFWKRGYKMYIMWTIGLVLASCMIVAGLVSLVFSLLFLLLSFLLPSFLSFGIVSTLLMMIITVFDCSKFSGSG